MANKKIPLPVISEFRHDKEVNREIINCVLLQSFLLFHLDDNSLLAKSLDRPEDEGIALISTGILRIYGNPSTDCAFAMTSMGEILTIRRYWNEIKDTNNNSSSTGKKLDGYAVDELETQPQNIESDFSIKEKIQSTKVDKISLYYAGGLNVVVLVLVNEIFIINMQIITDIHHNGDDNSKQVISINCVDITSITSVYIPNRDVLSETFYNELETSVQINQLEIVHLTIWGSSDQPYIVLIGQGAWILFIPLEIHSFGASISTATDAFNSKIIRHNLNLSGHRGAWLAVLTESFNHHVSASADLSGNIIIWSMPGNRELLDYIKPLMRIEQFASSAISALCLHNRGNELTMWTGDISGAIVCAELSVKTRSVKKIRRVGLRVGTVPMEIQLCRIPGEKNLCKLLSLDKKCGLLQSIILHDSIASVFNAWPEKLPLNDAVQACCVLNEHEILITAGHGKDLLLWDITSGKLLSKTVSPDAFFTSLVCYDDGLKDEIRIYSGHRNGKFNIFGFSLSTANRQRSGLLGMNPVMTESIISVSLFDILEGSVENSSLSDFLPSANDFKEQIGSVLSTDKDPINDKDDAFSINTADASTMDTEIDCIATLIDSKNYCPLPVTRIIVSVLGKHIAICFACTVMVVHKVDTNEALAKAEFGDQLVEICRVSDGMKKDSLKSTSLAGTDQLHVLLVGRSNIEVIDVLTSIVLTSFNFNLALNALPGISNTVSLAAGAVWDLGLDLNEKDSVDVTKNNYRGFLVSDQLELFTNDFNLEGTLSSKHVFRSPVISTDHESLVDNLIKGIDSFDSECSPITTLATLRRVFVFRMNMETRCVDLSPGKVTEYVVHSDGTCVRVVYAKALPISLHIRVHRILIVLSDGTASLVNV